MVARRFVIPILLMATALLSAGGCDFFESLFSDEQDKFHHSISQEQKHPPATVIEVVNETIVALQLQVLTRSRTNIDARFLVKSALGVEYKVLVQGMRTDKTKVVIYMPSWRNADQARLIMTEIHSRLHHPYLREFN